MDFIGGALPNVMFLIGVIAIGIGLGLEFQIIQVKNGLTRGGRIGACVVGVALVVTSIALYLRPSQTASGPTPALAAAASTATGAPPSQEPTTAPTDAPATAPTSAPTDAPTAIPTIAPTIAPTSAPTSVPTASPTSVPAVEVPDIRGMSPKDAGKALAQVGLQLGEPATSCEELGVAEELRAEARKGRIACQSVEPGSDAPEGSAIAYVLSDPKGND